VTELKSLKLLFLALYPTDIIRTMCKDNGGSMMQLLQRQTAVFGCQATRAPRDDRNYQK